MRPSGALAEQPFAELTDALASDRLTAAELLQLCARYGGVFGDELAARIAKEAVAEIDQLSLIGYPTAFDDVTRDVVETSVRLTVRRILESRVD